MSDTQELQPSSEFDIPLADTPEAEAPKKGSNPYVPGQPLPRLWKTEPNPEEDAEESLEDPKKKGSTNKDVATTASKSTTKPKGSSSKTAKVKPKKKKEDG